MNAINFGVMPDVPANVFTAELQKPSHLNDDWLEPKQRNYTTEEHNIWDRLYKRQMDILPGLACDQFFKGLSILDFDKGGVPDFNKSNEILKAETGWTMVPVPMLIPDHVFFYHLANRRFPTGNFIRTANQFDYIEEPDVFHDAFGHVPLLTDPSFADYMEAYGRAGWKALQYNHLKALSALYWYTVEFGLINTDDGMRIYGAGILSSPEESPYALNAKSPNRIHLNVDRVMRTDYKIDDLQASYFVIDSFEELFKMTVERPFDYIYENIGASFQYAPGAVLDTDHVYQRGTQEYCLRGGHASDAAPV
ncbi:phenylalanine 4-monooxygenase [Pseudemcibacter aquimaris]|uniref:phenylalanine 4-monooxygenase n=1 Tax=Pseudemcibacter aquimaris TaxID=2857064 RepID=UPI002010CE04|nr:phenylalanine 4-monooxygenase [Pseudemcibacter aquimaris]MCC3859800.1 phenylalanine 4-monooxygenase [Pseudemcibacter aquimaris]WDU60194.1 phenylalanine 4-monooxygenase [Pseudemcibacter aquimaris]